MPMIDGAAEHRREMGQDHIEVDGEGRLVLPSNVISHLGIGPGTRVRLERDVQGLRLRPPSSPAKLYVEPTNRCNLGCRTCIRNTWDEPMGTMAANTFDRILEGLKAFSPVPKVVFGGFGEPLFHTDIVDMVARTKATGAVVELVTNGTLLTKETSRGLVSAGLDMLWLSLDGATPESYGDIRLGAQLSAVIENAERFREVVMTEGDVSEHCCELVPEAATEIGIAFVAMRRNIADLPAVVDIGKKLDARRFLVTNVLPYSRDMVQEALYYRTLAASHYRELRLPDIDVDENSLGPILRATSAVNGNLRHGDFAASRGRCPFIDSGAGVVGWDGRFSPCLPLLYSHAAYLGYLSYDKRFSRSWAVGNVGISFLPDLWSNGRHLAFRERVEAFEFPPCTSCGSCDLFESNEEDCFGNEFPTCGGCLWAQGVLRCP
jgi:MoaA/NifB/PqqE/SkfB family radical SAM enzyme